MASQKLHFHRASILNPLSDTKCDYIQDGLLVVKGKKIKDLVSFAQGSKKYLDKINKKNFTDHGKALIMPGFYDLHFHWVQDDVREMPKDSLLEWLEKYTFPAEMKFAARVHADKKAKGFFKTLSATGTIGGACYSSIHECAIDAAMDHAQGDFVIGNVLMNMNSPKKLTQSEDDSLDLTKRLIKRYGKRFCFTPRFAITTSPRVMEKGSKMTDKAKCFKQTHLAETPKEIEFVLSIYKDFPEYKKVRNYTEIYHRAGMLGKRSLMGHGIHLSQEELNLLAKTKTTLVHCPTSNAPIKEKGLGSGLFDFKKVEKSKVRWALGSDIGGGPFLSMFDVMRSFVEQNKRKKITGATYTKALYRSTLAGAEILGKGKVSGNFAKGKFANFIVVPAPRKAAKKAEDILCELTGSLGKTRHKYADMVKLTVYKGVVLFRA